MKEKKKEKVKKMNIMFMPVGTVCEIQNINGKIMIVGYKENKYVGGYVVI